MNVFAVLLLLALPLRGEEDIQQEILVLKTQVADQKSMILEQNVKIAEQNVKIATQDSKICQVESSIISSGATDKAQGTYFMRWGRNDCPVNVTDIVYTGYIGGSYFKHPGGAAEYTCMPSEPIWGKNMNLVSSYSAFMYGTEYEGDPFYFGMKDTREDVPCAVCQSTSHSMSLMIPGRTECYDGWTKAYSGDLASGYPMHKSASQYICVDENPQTTGGEAVDNNGKLLYPVCVKCGAMPCPPYEDGKYLSCVVCMK